MTAFAGGNGAAIYSTMPTAVDRTVGDQPPRSAAGPLPDGDSAPCPTAQRNQCRA